MNNETTQQKELALEAKVAKQVKGVIKYAQEAIITTEEEMIEASEYVKEISTLQNAIEEQRTQFTKPLNTSLKNINAFFKKFSQPLEKADEELRAKLAACKKTMSEDQNMFGKIHFVSSTSYEIVDIKKVPIEYLSVDDRKVKAAIKAGVKTIKGLIIKNDPKVSL